MLLIIAAAGLVSALILWRATRTIALFVIALMILVWLQPPPHKPANLAPPVKAGQTGQ